MINEALRLIRVFHDMKQVQLAERIGVSNSHISEIEKGVKTPSLELINAYAKEFGMPVSSIMFFAETLPKAKAGDRVRSQIARKALNILQFIERKANAEGRT